jgi:hypothetical protein
MDKDRWANQTLKALGSHNITVTIEFLDGSYNPPNYTSGVIPGETGLLELLRIESNRPDLPSFRVRWDQTENSVNVDLLGDAEEARKFAQGSTGYRGHKTIRVNESPRTQAIDIETPSTGQVFKGTIALNIDLGLVLNAGLTMRADFQARAEVVRNAKRGLMSRLVRKLKLYLSMVFSSLRCMR